eukprot:gene9886-1782_t
MLCAPEALQFAVARLGLGAAAPNSFRDAGNHKGTGFLARLVCLGLAYPFFLEQDFSTINTRAASVVQSTCPWPGPNEKPFLFPSAANPWRAPIDLDQALPSTGPVAQAADAWRSPIDLDNALGNTGSARQTGASGLFYQMDSNEGQQHLGHSNMYSPDTSTSCPRPLLLSRILLCILLSPAVLYVRSPPRTPGRGDLPLSKGPPDRHKMSSDYPNYLAPFPLHPDGADPGRYGGSQSRGDVQTENLVSREARRYGQSSPSVSGRRRSRSVSSKAQIARDANRDSMLISGYFLPRYHGNNTKISQANRFKAPVGWQSTYSLGDEMQHMQKDAKHYHRNPYISGVNIEVSALTERNHNPCTLQDNNSSLTKCHNPAFGNIIEVWGKREMPFQ